MQKDSSTKSVESIVETFDDRRFRLIIFDENRGPSVARQQALDEARGEFICFLDADDWYFPYKLERQLHVLNEVPELTAVGAGIAVMNDQESLMGVRCYSPLRYPIRRGPVYSQPSMFVPSVMIRHRQAMAHRFDPRLERFEDRDYLQRVLAGHRYGVLPEVLYAYREVFSGEAMDEALCGFCNQRKVFWERLGDAPIQMGRQYLWSLVKSGVYGAAQAVGRGEWLFERRNRAATTTERREFDRSRREVRKVLDLVEEQD